MFRFCLEVEGGGLAVATAEAIEGIRVLGDCSSGGLQVHKDPSRCVWILK